MKRLTLGMAALAALVAGMSLMGCSTAPKTEAARNELERDAEAALARFHAEDPSLQNMLSEAHGYAVLPSVGNGAIVIGGAYGRGVVYERGTMIGYCDMTQGDIGLQLGGQSFSELIVFEHEAALDEFKGGKVAFAAQASAVAATAGASAEADYESGVAVFTMTNGGLMAEAAIGGQGFSYLPKDAVAVSQETPVAETATAEAQED